MGGEAVDAENAAAHAMDARAMREQYGKDIGSISNMHYVSTIDFAQNIAVPHTASTPSSWYFLSLIAVSRPSSMPVQQDIRRTDVALETALANLQPVPSSIANPEKVFDLHKKIPKYIPVEFRDNVIYLNMGNNDKYISIDTWVKDKAFKTSAPDQSAFTFKTD
ncbi:hypothetical protein ATCC90586_000427 [Pythium insidiosum]|nr:hypothetical protein ATCC90586_000427 [Pythium insidiosum]